MRLVGTLLGASLLLAQPLRLAIAHESTYVAFLTGAAESPPNDSPGVGFAIVTLNLDLITLRIDLQFSNLVGAVAAAHIHAATATPGEGVADAASQAPSFLGFPAGVTSGAYDQTFSLGHASTYDPAYISRHGGTVFGAYNALVNSLAAGAAYLNIHTESYAGGEIRGFLLADPPTDFNHDGMVEGGDLIVWAEVFGVHPDGDATGDGLSDGADFLQWQRQLGVAAHLGGGHGHVAAVPEPTAVQAMLAASGTALAATRRRQHARREIQIVRKNGCEPLDDRG